MYDSLHDISCIYLKHYGLKINGIKVDLTKPVLSHALGVATRISAKMKNLITHVETTQL